MKTILSIIALSTISFGASAVEEFTMADKAAAVEYIQQAKQTVYVNVFGNTPNLDARAFSKDLNKAGVNRGNVVVSGIKSNNQYIVVIKDSELD